MEILTSNACCLLKGKRVMCPHIPGCLDFIPPMLDQDAWSCQSRARSPRCEDAWWSSGAWRKAWHQALWKEAAMIFSSENHPKQHSRCQQMPTESATCILHGMKRNQILSSLHSIYAKAEQIKHTDMLIFHPLEGQVVVTKGDLIITSLNRSRRKCSQFLCFIANAFPGIWQKEALSPASATLICESCAAFGSFIVEHSWWTHLTNPFRNNMKRYEKCIYLQRISWQFPIEWDISDISALITFWHPGNHSQVISCQPRCHHWSNIPRLVAP